jgi:hypothetical protein
VFPCTRSCQASTGKYLLEPVCYGARSSAKLWLTCASGLIKLALTCCSSPFSIAAVRDQEPAHAAREGFSSRSIPHHDGPRRAISLSPEATAPYPCVILCHRLDFAPQIRAGLLSIAPIRVVVEAPVVLKALQKLWIKRSRWQGYLPTSGRYSRCACACDKR